MNVRNDGPADERNLTMILYGAYLLSPILGFSGLVAIIVNYVKRSEMTDPVIQDHFNWQIRTFWFSCLWAVIGLVLLVFGVGVVVLIGNFIWFLYRYVKRLIRLNEGKYVYQQPAIAAGPAVLG